MAEKVELLQSIVDNNDNIVFFGGAGVSTASGIPDYRSQTGIYRQALQYSPEEMISHSFFIAHTEEFYAFYKEKMLYLDAQPNAAHTALAALEVKGKLEMIITQNVDGLHQKAGADRVVELHGSVHRNYCVDCGEKYGAQYVCKSQGIPRCSCGGVVRPDVVLFEEQLDEASVTLATQAIRRAQVLIVGGTSLAVYPAAGFVRLFEGEHLVIINREPTPQDKFASLVIHEDIAQVFSALNV